MKVVNRKTKEEKKLVYNNGLKFLYKNFFGRIILFLINNRIIANIVGVYMNSKLSIKRIDKTIKENNIDMSLFEKKEWKSFNDFFMRYKKNLNIDIEKNHFIAPVDAKLLVVKLDDDAIFNIKGSIYTLDNIVKEDISSKYRNGYALIFRLDVSDYHHFHFVDDGNLEKYKYIKGKLNTVQPFAYNHKIFHTNSREYVMMHSENFGDIIEVDVGALLVGRITNNKSITEFKKGDEKGYFEFGGSTIILFVEENKIIVDDDILLNSSLGKETIVSCGEKIGIKYQKYNDVKNGKK